MYTCSPVQGKIANYGTYGMVVQVNHYIHGLCPTLHLADVRLKHPEKKLNKGADVRCRVRNEVVAEYECERTPGDYSLGVLWVTHGSTHTPSNPYSSRHDETNMESHIHVM